MFILAALLTLAAGPASARPAAPACSDEIGERRATNLARECRDVSPESRLSCRTSAPCEAIRDAIRRACRAAGQDAANICGLYVDEDEADEDEG